MSGECELCHEHTLECKCKKDIPMSENMRKFFERLIDLKLGIKEKLDIENNEKVKSYTLLKNHLKQIYNKLDSLIKEEK